MIHPFYNYHEPFLAGVLLNQKMTTRVLSMSSPCYVVTLPAQPFCMGYPEELCWTWFDILIYASTTQKVICSFELSLFSCLLTFVYQLIVRSNCAIVFIDAYYSCGLSSHSIPDWLGETNSSTSSISWTGQSSCIPQIKMPIQLLFCSTLENYPLYVRIVIGIATSLMNSWHSDTLSIIIHFSVSVLLQPECRQVNRDVWNLYS